mmetsp:Transcript_95055/g.246106  ORF Transcript_95055/g.246106 Transcript_95055/m.246106 type:complete len:426 (-) Transcript_95055:480-1757(-)
MMEAGIPQGRRHQCRTMVGIRQTTTTTAGLGRRGRVVGPLHSLIPVGRKVAFRRPFSHVVLRRQLMHTRLRITTNRRCGSRDLAQWAAWQHLPTRPWTSGAVAWTAFYRNAMRDLAMLHNPTPRLPEPLRPPELDEPHRVRRWGYAARKALLTATRIRLGMMGLRCLGMAMKVLILRGGVAATARHRMIGAARLLTTRWQHHTRGEMPVGHRGTCRTGLICGEGEKPAVQRTTQIGMSATWTRSRAKGVTCSLGIIPQQQGKVWAVEWNRWTLKICIVAAGVCRILCREGCLMPVPACVVAGEMLAAPMTMCRSAKRVPHLLSRSASVMVQLTLCSMTPRPWRHRRSHRGQGDGRGHRRQWTIVGLDSRLGMLWLRRRLQPLPQRRRLQRRGHVVELVVAAAAAAVVVVVLALLAPIAARLRRRS